MKLITAVANAVLSVAFSFATARGFFTVKHTKVEGPWSVNLRFAREEGTKDDDFQSRL